MSAANSITAWILLICYICEHFQCFGREVLALLSFFYFIFFPRKTANKVVDKHGKMDEVK